MKPLLALLAAPCVALAIREAEPELTPEVASLKDLAGIHVRVELGGQPGGLAGLRRDELQAAVEAQIRAAGLTLLATGERAQGQPAFVLQVVAFPVDERRAGPWVYSVDAALQQEVRLLRNPGLKLAAPTWRATGAVGTVDAGDVPALRKLVSEQVEQFAGACSTARAG
jgi:hypothetical protein